MRAPVRDRGPGETAFVLTRAEGGWRYAGVGRWLDAEGLWVIPAVDRATAKALGDGKASRRLDPVWQQRAEALVAGLEQGEWTGWALVLCESRPR